MGYDDWAAVEQLLFEVKKEDVQSFFVADADTWTPFLQSVDGFAGRIQLVDAKAYNDSSVPSSSNITIANLIMWDSYDAWKAIPAEDLQRTQDEFAQQFGSSPTPQAIPSNEGWMIYQGNGTSFSSSSSMYQLQSPLGCFLIDSPVESACTLQGGSSCSEGGMVPQFYLYGFYSALAILITLVCYVTHLHNELRYRRRQENLDLLNSFSYSSEETRRSSKFSLTRDRCC